MGFRRGNRNLVEMELVVAGVAVGFVRMCLVLSDRLRIEDVLLLCAHALLGWYRAHFADLSLLEGLRTLVIGETRCSVWVRW
jgi:hypothetical protein